MFIDSYLEVDVIGKLGGKGRTNLELEDCLMNERIKTYREYWTHHVGQHEKAGNRALHYLGSASAVTLLFLVPALQVWWPIPLAVAAVFVPGMIGHVVIEHSPREEHHYPLWAVASDLRMLGLFLIGRIGMDFRRADVDEATPH